MLLLEVITMSSRNIALLSTASVIAIMLSPPASAAPRQGAYVAPALSADAQMRAAIRLNRAMQESEHLSAMGASVNDINRPWQILTRALADKFGLSDGKFVQLAFSPQPADWNDPTYGAYRTSFYGDSMPKWGASFDPQNASSFADVYGTFINSIALRLPNPSDQAQADDARSKWNTCNVGLQNQYKLIGQHWASFNAAQAGLPPARRLTFDVWFQRFEAGGLQTQQGKCDALAVTYNHWFNLATAGQANLANAIQRYSQAAQINAPVPGSDRVESVWPYTFVQDLSAFITASDTKPQPDFDQTFDNQSGTYNATSSSWGASASYGWFFHASGGGSSSTVDTHSSEFKMRVTIKGLQTFDVRPSNGWFSQQLVQFYRHGPFQPGSPIAQRDASGTLYGPDGVFSLRAARYIVAYQPRIELTMSSHDYSEAKSSWSAGGGFGIGPFSFGGGASSSTTHITWNDQTNTLVAEDTSKVPQVIAVVTDVLPDFQ
jgi:hypothetical protein